MTSAGMLILVAGVFVGVTWGSPYPRTYNLADRIGIALFYTGFALLLAGVATWLWEVMP